MYMYMYIYINTHHIHYISLYMCIYILTYKNGKPKSE